MNPFQKIYEKQNSVLDALKPNFRATSTLPITGKTIASVSLPREVVTGKTRTIKTSFLMRFMLLVNLMDYQKSTFQKDLVGQVKQDFNNLNNHIQNWRRRVLGSVGAEAQEEFDNLTDAAWEVLNEFDKASDKRQLLAVMMAYNEGLVSMEGIDKPLNEVSFEEVVAKGREAKELAA